MDRYASLGLPLLVSLTVPSGGEPIPEAARKNEVVHYAGAALAREAAALGGTRAAARFWPSSPCKASSGINSSTASRTPLPTADLFDERDQPKPILDFLASCAAITWRNADDE